MSLKVLIFPLSLVIALAVVIFLIKPAYSEMTSIKNSLQEKNVLLDNLQNQNQKLQKVKSKWESLAEEKNLVAAAFPDEDNIDAYVSELTSKAGRSGILLTDINMAQKGGASSEAGTKSAYLCGVNPAGGTAVALPPDQVSEIATVSGTDGSAGPVSSGCFNAVGISLMATGSWEQVLDFFKYIEDMNRISNIESVSLAPVSQVQDQAATDLLKADISATAFFKGKTKNGNATLAGSLAGQENFNQKALEKLKNAIYSAYDVPAVSPSGERNIFK